MTVLEMEKPAVPDGTPRQFTTQEYRKIRELGLLGDGADLVDGIVVIRGTMRPWRWTTGDYYKLAEEGIIDEDERVELIDGEVMVLAPIGPEHMAAMAGTTRALIRLEDSFGPDFCVLPESSIPMTGDFTPQPDVIVAKGSLKEFAKRGVAPSDIKLIVEVSNTSLRTDKKRKYLLYAQMSIPEYWVVNLVARTLDVYREPTGNGYQVALSYKSGESVEPSFAPSASVKIDDILPS